MSENHPGGAGIPDPGTPHSYWQAALERAFAGSPWPPELGEHVASCDECADSLLVERYLEQLAAIPAAVAPRLPPAAAIWEQAMRRNRYRQHLPRIARPVQVMENVSALMGIVLLAWGITRIWPRLSTTLAGLQSALQTPGGPAGTDAFLPGLLVLLTLLTAVAAFPVLARE